MTDESTRQRLIRAGIQLFGEHGYKATTTRMLADAAQANIGSIAYYFDNKHGLYLAAARYIAGALRERLGIQAVAAVPEDRAMARRELERLVRRMVRTFATDVECRQWLLMVMREQLHPSDAFEVLQHQAFGVVQLTLSQHIACLTGRGIEDPVTTLETHTLVGQIVFFLIAREPLLRRLSLQQIDDNTLEAMEEVVVSHLRLFEPDA
ncbi:CerR family C-terminal domain-containing protein [Halomonas sp. 18H]|uniref:CerR family C-terminal domain-containing protein n=1 Tax=Halomonas almeriensis TaxID=308163 RepID=UPI0022320169|nr:MULTISPECIES: CerR family C-terminal domain-containing protein [Halomonas]MCW4152548.1 CerR family C-terminal domain-containing protein [Halomonas sp. 18H]MDN3553876.1 CerR family C-terminal domain-containing protein [Halomonas almeriensis]